MRDSFRPLRDDGAPADAKLRRQSVFEQIAEFVRDEAIGHVVDKASGGWLSYEGNDGEDDAPRRASPPADSFNDRIERALAELRAKEQGAPAATSVIPTCPQDDRSQLDHVPPRPSVANPPVVARGFGRKIV